ncbi:hypothetical protein Hte_004800 [Hypoxylon texense]
MAQPPHKVESKSRERVVDRETGEVIWDTDEAQRRADGMQLEKRRREYFARRDSRVIDDDDSFEYRPRVIQRHDRDVRDHIDRIAVQDILLERKIDGIWDPRNTSDLTVHLKMPVQEDLEEVMEEFCRLQRLGDFTSATQFFRDNLQDHLDKPYILIEYAEMLLEQGDYNTLSGLHDDAIYNAGSNMRDTLDGGLLIWYWELVRVFVACHKPSAFLKDSFDSILSGLDRLRYSIALATSDDSSEKENISSTEVKMLALACRLGNLPNRRVRNQMRLLFSDFFFQSLYTNLLRNGRIWDLRDIAIARMLTPGVDITNDWSFDPDIRRRVQGLITDWSGVGEEKDTSTTLALLDILMSLILDELMTITGTDDLIEDILDQCAPLVFAIIEKDPASMRSRPFMRWMLAKSRFTHTKGSGYVESQRQNLQSSEGITFYTKRTRLPQYIPLKAESPGWIPNQSPPDFEDSARIVAKTSKSLGDYQTESIALQELIKLSANPAKEFGELSNIQKLAQGDFYNYSKTLISKYLICDTDELRNDLKTEISGLFSIPFFSNCLDVVDSWTLRMVQYALEGEGPTAKQALEAADKTYRELPEEFRREVDEKFPGVKGRARRAGGSLRNPNATHAEWQEEEDRLGFEQKILDAKKKRLETERRDAEDLSDNDLKDIHVTIQPDIPKGKKMTVSFENVEISPNKPGTSDQPAPTQEELVTGLKVFNIEPQKQGDGMKEAKIHVTRVRDDKKSSGATPTSPEVSFAEKRRKAEKILYYLETELVKAMEDESPEKHNDTADKREYLKIAIDDQKKEMLDIDEQEERDIRDKREKLEKHDREEAAKEMLRDRQYNPPKPKKYLDITESPRSMSIERERKPDTKNVGSGADGGRQSGFVLDEESESKQPPADTSPDVKDGDGKKEKKSTSPAEDQDAAIDSWIYSIEEEPQIDVDNPVKEREGQDGVTPEEMGAAEPDKRPSGRKVTKRSTTSK